MDGDAGMMLHYAPRMDFRNRLFVVSIAFLAACSGPADPDGGSVDAAGTDAGETDAGPGVDAGPMDCAPQTVPALTFEAVGSGWSAPLFLTQPPGSDDFYVLQQGGLIQRLATDGSVSEFVDVSGLVPDVMPGTGDETGLLGMAFHPDYATNGRFFLYYAPSGSNRLDEFARIPGTETADPTPVATLIDIPDPEWNHNGGMLAFGPDGFLYVGTGDGGGGGDRHGPTGNGLNLDTLLGKILRIDVDNAAGGFAAAGNPFEGGGGLAQIWAYGIRNPWRFSFDRVTGDLYIGDVGQGNWEEIDFQPASSSGGENYGWRAYEGLEVFCNPGTTACMDELALVPVHAEPVVVYPHAASACSVTGGYVYRGSAIAGLQGWYLYGDYCTGNVSAFRMCGGEAVDVQDVPGLASGFGLTSFAEDQSGELYMLTGSSIRRIIGG